MGSLILGIETSCDETAAAVVRDGRVVESSVVNSQIASHRPYGGVVPEIASRMHVEAFAPVVEEAMERAGRTWEELDGIAVTHGPGLVAALLVGLSGARALGQSAGKPVWGVNHMEGHLAALFLDPKVPGPEELGRAVVLMVSGGHSYVLEMEGMGRYQVLGQTLDDAAGEAFDKASKLLGLGYPGGPKVDKIAAKYAEAAGLDPKGADWSKSLIPFPKGRPRDGVAALSGLSASLCVSFSGLKTSLLRHVQQHKEILSPAPDAKMLPDSPVEGVTMEMARVVASYQEAIVQSVAERTRTALSRRDYKALVLGGGVSLNSRIRTVLSVVAKRAGVPLLMAKPKYCGDNGAMIAGLAYFKRTISGDEAMKVDVHPSLEAGD